MTYPPPDDSSPGWENPDDYDPPAERWNDQADPPPRRRTPVERLIDAVPGLLGIFFLLVVLFLIERG